jgi:hypothetical protein
MEYQTGPAGATGRYQNLLRDSGRLPAGWEEQCIGYPAEDFASCTGLLRWARIPSPSPQTAPPNGSFARFSAVPQRHASDSAIKPCRPGVRGGSKGVRGWGEKEEGRRRGRWGGGGLPPRRMPLSLPLGRRGGREEDLPPSACLSPRRAAAHPPARPRLVPRRAAQEGSKGPKRERRKLGEGGPAPRGRGSGGEEEVGGGGACPPGARQRGRGRGRWRGRGRCSDLCGSDWIGDSLTLSSSHWS